MLEAFGSRVPINVEKPKQSPILALLLTKRNNNKRLNSNSSYGSQSLLDGLDNDFGDACVFAGRDGEAGDDGLRVECEGRELVPVELSSLEGIDGFSVLSSASASSYSSSSMLLLLPLLGWLVLVLLLIHGRRKTKRREGSTKGCYLLDWSNRAGRTMKFMLYLIERGLIDR